MEQGQSLPRFASATGSLSAAEFVGLLKPWQHRAYSISSSPKEAEGHVHPRPTDQDLRPNPHEENGKALFSWLKEDASFYVCGDASRMARDVDAALEDIIAKHGGMVPEKAAEYVSGLKREKRYLRGICAMSTDLARTLTSSAG